MRTEALLNPEQGSDPHTPQDAQFERRARWIFIGLLAIAFFTRLYLALTTAYTWDEERDWVFVVQKISFDPDNLSLPIRGVAHPALAAYFHKLAVMLFGENALGYRIAPVLAGVLMIWAAGRIALRWLGWTAACWTAALLASNEYHMGISAFVGEKIFYLLFMTLAVWAFSEFLRSERPAMLYVAGAMTGLSFMCKELGALLLPVFFLALLAAGKAAWLKRKEPYLAVAAFVLVISPDIYWNLNRPVDPNIHGSYSEHFQRAGGIGFARQHFLFYGRDAIAAAYRLAGRRLTDPAEEYPTMNALMGGLMLASVGLGVLGWKKQDPTARLLIMMFLFILIFFLLIRKGTPRGELDAVVWVWVDSTMLPGSLLLAYALTAAGKWRRFARTAAVAAMAYAMVFAWGYRLNMPAHSMVFSPVVIWPADGRMAGVQAHFNGCYLCNAEYTFARVRTVHDGTQVQPASDDIQGAVIGEPSRELQVRAVKPEEARVRAYQFTYLAKEKSGRTEEVRSAVVVGQIERPLPFWARPSHVSGAAKQ